MGDWNEDWGTPALADNIRGPEGKKKVEGNSYKKVEGNSYWIKKSRWIKKKAAAERKALENQLPGCHHAEERAAFAASKKKDLHKHFKIRTYEEWVVQGQVMSDVKTQILCE